MFSGKKLYTLLVSIVIITGTIFLIRDNNAIDTKDITCRLEGPNLYPNSIYFPIGLEDYYSEEKNGIYSTVLIFPKSIAVSQIRSAIFIQGWESYAQEKDEYLYHDLFKRNKQPYHTKLAILFIEEGDRNVIKIRYYDLCRVAN